jgi:hypothetical protein
MVFAVDALPNQAVKGQQPDLAIDDQRRCTEFRAPIDRWQKTDDPEENIAVLEEPRLKASPEHSPLMGSAGRSALQLSVTNQRQLRREPGEGDRRLRGGVDGLHAQNASGGLRRYAGNWVGGGQ